MRFPKIARALVAGSLLAGGSSAAFAGDACKNVKFQYKNMRKEAIVVYKVEYFNRANGKVQTEDVKNDQCNGTLGDGTFCTTNPNNLRDSEGENLTDFVFYFFVNDPLHVGVKEFHTQPKKPLNETCIADRFYAGSPTWEINY
jgi:hypothetical protein